MMRKKTKKHKTDRRSTNTKVPTDTKDTSQDGTIKTGGKHNKGGKKRKTRHPGKNSFSIKQDRMKAVHPVLGPQTWSSERLLSLRHRYRHITQEPLLSQTMWDHWR